MSALGTPGLETPNMDRIAREGVLFRQAYVAYPVCSASKGALYTGLYPHTNGLRHNTRNYFWPASKVTAAQNDDSIVQRMRIDDRYPTLIELLHRAGYYTGVTFKLHVQPNDKFPYDEFIPRASGPAAAQFIRNATRAGKPWFLMYNTRWAHRPYRNSDEVGIGVDPAAVDPPHHLPDTPVVRKDWAEYLDAVQLADGLVGQALAALDASGQAGRTIVVFMGDHGPAFQRGKMAVTDFGLHVPLAVAGPGIPAGRTSDELVSEVDLMPTLLDLLGLPRPSLQQGVSISPLLRGETAHSARKHAVGEISHGAQKRDDGMQERSIYDGRYRLVYREGVDKPRDMNADLWRWQWRPSPRNRTYAETIRRRNEYPQAYELLRQVFPQKLSGKPPPLELYDRDNDPWELENLAGRAEYAPVVARLRAALAQWATRTDDRYIDRQSLARPAPATPD